MLPLVGELAPPHRKALCLSILTSGYMLGILIARLLSGTITQFISWRSVYFLGLGLQSLMTLLLILFMPDYPRTNAPFPYLNLLASIPALPCRHPALLQACLTALFTSATFTTFWTTLTFLLAAPPYSFPPLSIGLFSLVGIGAMLVGPLFARAITDRFVPWFAVVAGELIALAGIVVGTYTGAFSLAGPVVQAFLFDLGFMAAQVANRTAIYKVAPRARNRVNTVFMVFTFCGQLMGTAVGSRVYARWGWVASGSVSVGFVCVSLGVCAVRGPGEEGWVGWTGGWAVRRRPEVGEGLAGGGEEGGKREEVVVGEEGREGGDERVRGGGEEVVREADESDAEKRRRSSEKSGSDMGIEKAGGGEGLPDAEKT